MNKTRKTFLEITITSLAVFCAALAFAACAAQGKGEEEGPAPLSALSVTIAGDTGDLLRPTFRPERFGYQVNCTELTKEETAQYTITAAPLSSSAAVTINGKNSSPQTIEVTGGTKSEVTVRSAVSKTLASNYTITFITDTKDLEIIEGEPGGGSGPKLTALSLTDDAGVNHLTAFNADTFTYTVSFDWILIGTPLTVAVSAGANAVVTIKEDGLALAGNKTAVPQANGQKAIVIAAAEQGAPSQKSIYRINLATGQALYKVLPNANIASKTVPAQSGAAGQLDEVHIFTGDAPLKFHGAVPAAAWVLVVAGGGGGGGTGSDTGKGGGGGAGGYLEKEDLPLIAGQTSYAITVGTGGAGGPPSNNGTNGALSSFGTWTQGDATWGIAGSAIRAAGGGGGGFDDGSNGPGNNGGSGGGGAFNKVRGEALAVLPGSPAQGNPGRGQLNTSKAGGGGGADSEADSSGKGGDSKVSSITGENKNYAGGGASGHTTLSIEGADNTGNGGGGSKGGKSPNASSYGKKGGSGIVIVRFPHNY